MLTPSSIPIPDIITKNISTINGGFSTKGNELWYGLFFNAILAYEKDGGHRDNILKQINNEEAKNRLKAQIETNGNKLKQIETNIQYDLSNSLQLPELQKERGQLSEPVDMSEYLFSGRKIPEQQYMYLVHAISSGLQAAVGLSHIRKQGLTNNSFAINLLTELDKYCQKPIVSTSLISHNKHATRAKSGLIINAPKETIINAGSHDLGTAYDGSGASNTQYGVVSPNTLINQSCPTGHNEVVVSNKGVVKSSVQGFFIKVDEYGYPLDWDYRALKNHLAEKYGKQHPSNNGLQKVGDMGRNLFEHCQSDTIVAMAKQHKKPLVLIIEKDGARKEYMYPKIREELGLQEGLY